MTAELFKTITENDDIRPIINGRISYYMTLISQYDDTISPADLYHLASAMDDHLNANA